MMTQTGSLLKRMRQLWCYALLLSITLTTGAVGAANKVTTNAYDNFGNKTLETIDGFDPAGNPVTRTTTWQYLGPLNQLSFMDGPRTDVNDYTTYRYYPNDATQPIGTRARLKEIEDATGVLIRSNIQYTLTGKVSSEARPNGLSISYTYYAGNDRLATLTESSGTQSRTTKWTYLATGEVESITTAFGSPDATTLTFGYDDARRLISLTDGLGNHIDYTLDTEGNRLEEITFDSTGALKKQLTQTFDIYNRLDTASQVNEAKNLDFAPDGTLDLETDGNNTVTDYSYDALKRLTQTVQDLGGTDPTTANTTTGYGYDVADRLTSVTDPINGNTTYAFDDLGNLVSQTSPDTGTTSFQYDGASNVIQKTDAKGQVFVYTYDALNRLTGVDAPGTDDDITTTYDNCRNGIGKLCQVTYGAGFPNGSSVHYQYNSLGDLVGHQGLLFGYDNAQRLTTVDYPSGAQLRYFYDVAGNIDQVDYTVGGQTQTLVSSMVYAPLGPLTSATYGNGKLLTTNLDTAYRTIGINTPSVLERTYTQFDSNGNLLAITDPLSSNSTHSYDALNQLNTSSGPFGTRDFDHNKNGNRSQLTVDGQTTPYSYTPNTNRLSQIGTTPVLLDNNGNTLNQGLWSYTWSPYNRLSTATENSTLKASFAYNGLGQRFQKTDTQTNQGRYYLYGSNSALLVETDLEGNILTEHLYLNGQPLGVFFPDDDQDGITNQEEAALGTLPADTDQDGDGLTNLDEWFIHGTDSANADSDGDGINDDIEISQGTDPNDPQSGLQLGDVNGDGQINVGDLVVLTRIVMGLHIPTPGETTRGDMNQDSLLNAADVLLLQKLLLSQAINQLWIQTPAQETRVASIAPHRRQSAKQQHWFENLFKNAEAVPSTHGQLYYAHNDQIGTPQALTDEAGAGAVVWTATYDPFGKATINEDPDNDGNSVTFNLRLSGQYYDQETGMHQNGHRYLDPKSGRFLSSDHIGLFGGINTYNYAELNPILLVDPSGLVVSGEWAPGGKPRIVEESITVGLGIVPYSNGLLNVFAHGIGNVSFRAKCTDDDECNDKKTWYVDDGGNRYLQTPDPILLTGTVEEFNSKPVFLDELISSATSKVFDSLTNVLQSLLLDPTKICQGRQ